MKAMTLEPKKKLFFYLDPLGFYFISISIQQSDRKKIRKKSRLFFFSLQNNVKCWISLIAFYLFFSLKEKSICIKFKINFSIHLHFSVCSANRAINFTFSLPLFYLDLNLLDSLLWNKLKCIKNILLFFFNKNKNENYYIRIKIRGNSE